jgi:hypothetical protein
MVPESGIPLLGDWMAPTGHLKNTWCAVTWVTSRFIFGGGNRPWFRRLRVLYPSAYAS